MYFTYGQKEISYLKGKCKKLASIIDRVGYIQRPTDKDLFSSVIHHIVGQQISAKAQAAVWKKLTDDLPKLSPQEVLKAGETKLQSFGMTFKKAGYITAFAQKIQNGKFDLNGIWNKTDEEAVKELSALAGIGVWTAEMILLFCMERPNILSYQDLGIQRGLRMLYHHRKITKPLFEKYRKRFSPYCSTASLYFWAVAGGAVSGMKDYAPANTRK